MSVIQWLLECLLLVLILYSFWLHKKANVVIDNVEMLSKKTAQFFDESKPKLERAFDNLTSTLGKAEGELVYYRAAFDDIKEKADAQLSIPIGDHLFHAFMNSMITLGATDMAKEDKAKQTMALIGFQNIGRHIAKGLKHEIPAVEMLNKYSDGAQSSDGGFGVESIMGKVLGMDIPPGTFELLNQQSKPLPQKTSNSNFQY